ncbi:MAG: hypothetical protein U5K27_15835 [Desulfotignum sp.]|nr:hypothetical protein [Desulfotignum sp.]
MGTLFTIGFTRKPARQFFTLLQTAGVRRLAAEYIQTLRPDMAIVHLQ